MNVRLPIPVVVALLFMAAALLDPTPLVRRLFVTAPIKADGFNVLIVEETSTRDKLSPAQLAVIHSTQWRDYVSRSNGSWRMLDPDTDVEKEAAWVKEAMAVKRDSLPWWIVSNGRSGVSQPLPQNVDEALATLRKYGGTK